MQRRSRLRAGRHAGRTPAQRELFGGGHIDPRRQFDIDAAAAAAGIGTTRRCAPCTSMAPMDPGVTRRATRTGHARPLRGITTAEPVAATEDMSRTTSLRCQTCGQDSAAPSGVATVSAVDTSGGGGALWRQGRCSDSDAQPAQGPDPPTTQQADRGEPGTRFLGVHGVSLPALGPQCCCRPCPEPPTGLPAYNGGRGAEYLCQSPVL